MPPTVCVEHIPCVWVPGLQVNLQTKLTVVSLEDRELGKPRKAVASEVSIWSQVKRLRQEDRPECEASVGSSVGVVPSQRVDRGCFPDDRLCLQRVRCGC